MAGGPTGETGQPGVVSVDRRFPLDEGRILAASICGTLVGRPLSLRRPGPALRSPETLLETERAPGPDNKEAR